MEETIYTGHHIFDIELHSLLNNYIEFVKITAPEDLPFSKDICITNLTTAIDRYSINYHIDCENQQEIYLNVDKDIPQYCYFLAILLIVSAEHKIEAILDHHHNLPDNHGELPAMIKTTVINYVEKNKLNDKDRLYRIMDWAKSVTRYHPLSLAQPQLYWIKDTALLLQISSLVFDQGYTTYQKAFYKALMGQKEKWKINVGVLIYLIYQLKSRTDSFVEVRNGEAHGYLKALANNFYDEDGKLRKHNLSNSTLYDMRNRPTKNLLSAINTVKIILSDAQIPLI